MGQVYGSLDEAGDPRQSVEFKINDNVYKVSSDVPPGTSLNVFIREYANLKGTKSSCLEGGCGACIVSAKRNGSTMAVNSCLVPVLICDGWEIKTIEGIGNKMNGYHPIQATLAEMNGSQCGYCSPGMVMNLYSLLQEGEHAMKDIENSFGSNICRCTGYRPILDAFKSFATDAKPSWKKKIQDIEELYKVKSCPKSGKPCTNQCKDEQSVALPGPVRIDLENAYFEKVMTIDGLFALFASRPDDTYVLNGGNTAHGVYRLEKPKIYVDINDISDLHRIDKDAQGLTLGGNVSLSMAMKAFDMYSMDTGFEYLRHLVKHLDLVASVPVRNIGTIAGNLMIKHQHNEFPSDVFLILETAGAKIHILETPVKKASMTLLEFLKTDMKHKLIYSVVLPALSNEYEFRSYKVMPRAQNAHAHVNAGFLFKLDGTGKVLEEPNIIIGGIRPDFTHAVKTEKFLTGKSVLDRSTLQKALQSLDGELNPDHVLPDYSPKFRKRLACGLFYKFVLSIKPENLDMRLRSGSEVLERSLSSGKQDYDTDRNIWPVNKPVPKLESIYQTSGKGQYTNDIPLRSDEVFCAFVLSDIHKGKIESIDASAALEMKGVVAFYSAKDIPGKNAFISAANKQILLNEDELLFADKEVQYTGQPIGVVVAESNDRAQEAAKKVKVKYSGAGDSKPMISIQDVLQSNDKSRMLPTVEVPAQRKGTDVKHVIKGDFEGGSQYHFTMEKFSAVCHPVEDGMDVFATSQWPDLTNVAVSQLLNLPMNRVNVQVRRLGGGYGAKISRSTQTTCACALVAHKLNRPARIVLTIEDTMRHTGKRPFFLQQYELGVNDDGVIQYMNSHQWSTAGCSFNEFNSPFVYHHLSSCYDASTWTTAHVDIKTDTPSNTFCRAPGSTEANAIIENIMDHIARVTKKDPIEVRLANMIPEDKAMLQPMVEDLMKTSDYNMRKKAVEQFNRENRWKKKGMAIVTMKYPFAYFGCFNALVSVYARDGTVSVSHGGIEMGQGINTKVAQAAAYTLGIDLDLIIVKPTTNLVSPNQCTSGGSLTSECCVVATIMACKRILKRLEPIKQELNNPPWKELVMQAHMKDVDLCARYMMTSNDVSPYGIYGTTIAEVEIDALTGQHIIHRVDLMEDVGISLNPEIDLGQVEGAFIMGVGYWTSEELIYDPKTAVLTNHRTWNYKPPGAKDIPVDFRVYFRRNAPNPVGVLRSKATGEPPLCMSCVIPFAIRNALNAARADAGNKDLWYPLPGPLTTEKILMNSLSDLDTMII